MSCLAEDKSGGKAAKKNKRKKKPGPTVHQAEMTQSQSLLSLCAGYYKVPTFITSQPVACVRHQVK